MTMAAEIKNRWGGAGSGVWCFSPSEHLLRVGDTVGGTGRGCAAPTRPPRCVHGLQDGQPAHGQQGRRRHRQAGRGAQREDRQIVLLLSSRRQLRRRSQPRAACAWGRAAPQQPAAAAGWRVACTSHTHPGAGRHSLHRSVQQRGPSREQRSAAAGCSLRCCSPCGARRAGQGSRQLRDQRLFFSCHPLPRMLAGRQAAVLAKPQLWWPCNKTDPAPQRAGASCARSQRGRQFSLSPGALVFTALEAQHEQGRALPQPMA
jgi:hypothetical protein